MCVRFGAADDEDAVAHDNNYDNEIPPEDALLLTASFFLGATYIRQPHMYVLQYLFLASWIIETRRSYCSFTSDREQDFLLYSSSLPRLALFFSYVSIFV